MGTSNDPELKSIIASVIFPTNDKFPGSTRRGRFGLVRRAGVLVGRAQVRRLPGPGRGDPSARRKALRSGKGNTAPAGLPLERKAYLLFRASGLFAPRQCVKKPARTGRGFNVPNQKSARGDTAIQVSRCQRNHLYLARPSFYNASFSGSPSVVTDPLKVRGDLHH